MAFILANFLAIACSMGVLADEKRLALVVICGKGASNDVGCSTELKLLMKGRT